MKSLLYFIALAMAVTLVDCTRLVKPVSNHHLKTEGIVSETGKPANITPSIIISDNQVCNTKEVVPTNNLTKNPEMAPTNFSVPVNNPSGTSSGKEKPVPVLDGKPKTIYSIQLLAVVFPHPLNSPIFKGRKVKEEYSDADHLFRYSTGNFRTKERAMLEAKKIQSDFPGAFITAVLNGKKVPTIGMEIIARSEMEIK